MSGRRITAQNHHILSHESCDPRHAADGSSGLSQACLSREADKSIGQSQGLEGARHLPLRRLKTDLESTTVYGKPKFSDTACTRQDSVFVAPPEPDLAIWPTEGHDQDGGGRTRPTGPWTQYGFLQTACPEGQRLFELGRHSRCSSTRPKPACWQSVAIARPYGREITLLCLGQRRGLPHSTCHPCDGSSAESPHGDCLLRRCTLNTTTDENGSDKSKPVRRSIQFDFAVGSYDSHHGCQRQRPPHLAVR